MPIRAVFFDVAHTLLHKPNVLPTIQNVLHRNGIDVPIDEVELRHKLLMDAIVFPDQPTSEFYELSMRCSFAPLGRSRVNVCLKSYIVQAEANHGRRMTTLSA